MSPADQGPGQPRTDRLREELHSAGDLIQPDPLPFAVLVRAAARRHRARTSALSVAAVAAAVVGAAVGLTGLRLAGGTPAAVGPRPSVAEHRLAPRIVSNAGMAACGAAGLSVSWLPYAHGSMPGTVYFLRLKNTGGYTCAIKGYPRLVVAGPASVRGARAVYAPGNAALGRIPLSTVHLAPGRAVLSQVLFGGPAGKTGCVSPVWKVFVPLSRGRHPVTLAMPRATGARLCKDMPYQVSPVYPASQRRGLPPGLAAGSGRRQAAFRQALATVRAYLATWKSQGLRVADDEFLPPQLGPGPRVAGPRLVDGKVMTYRPVSWTSPGHFTLAVDLYLQFPGKRQAWAAWRNGENSRFVSFTRSSATPTGYRMALATGP